MTENGALLVPKTLFISYFHVNMSPNQGVVRDARWLTCTDAYNGTYNYLTKRRELVHLRGPLEKPLSHSIYWKTNMKGAFWGDIQFLLLQLNRGIFAKRNVPAVFHQVEHNLVQHLLKQSCPNPQILDSLWDEAGQSRHLTNAVLTLQALTSSVDGDSGRF